MPSSLALMFGTGLAAISPQATYASRVAVARWLLATGAAIRAVATTAELELPSMSWWA